MESDNNLQGLTSSALYLIICSLIHQMGGKVVISRKTVKEVEEGHIFVLGSVDEQDRFVLSTVVDKG
jgi:hypothetical protein